MYLGILIPQWVRADINIISNDVQNIPYYHIIYMAPEGLFSLLGPFYSNIYTFFKASHLQSPFIMNIKNEVERKSCRFGTTWGRVNHKKMVNCPFKSDHAVWLSSSSWPLTAGTGAIMLSKGVIWLIIHLIRWNTHEQMHFTSQMLLAKVIKAKLFVIKMK